MRILGRVPLTHDAATIPDFAFTRIAASEWMPGVLIIRRGMAVGQAIDEILLVEDVMTANEMDGQIRYLPL